MGGAVVAFVFAVELPLADNALMAIKCADQRERLGTGRGLTLLGLFKAAACMRLMWRSA